MTNKPKAKGTLAETAVVRVLKDAGFRAKRLTLHGSSDVGDIDCGLDEVCIEVKGGHAAEQASDGQIVKWLAETEKERVNAGAKIGILIVKRHRVGPANAGQWWAIMSDTAYCWLMGFGAKGFGLTIRMTLAEAIVLLRELSVLDIRGNVPED